MSNSACPCCSAPVRPRRGGLFSGLFKLMLVYVALVFAAGTLINTRHPVAVEAGRLIQTVTFIEPAIDWTQTHGYEHVAYGLSMLAHGVEFS